MIDQRPKTDQYKEKDKVAPKAEPEPSTTALPTTPIVTGPQSKRPDSGGNSGATPKDPARLSTQAKP